MEKHMTGRRSP